MGELWRYGLKYKSFVENGVGILEKSGSFIRNASPHICKMS